MVAGIPKHLLYSHDVLFGLCIPLYPPLCVVYPLVIKKHGEVDPGVSSLPCWITRCQLKRSGDLVKGLVGAAAANE